MGTQKPFYRNIPNILTLLRMVIALPFFIYLHDIIVYNCTSIISTIIFFFIIFSDLLDGKFARLFNCSTLIGAKLDVLADSIYSLLSILIFVYYKLLPVWFLLLLIAKLLEFIITSSLFKKMKISSSVASFDKLGKFGTGVLMVIPGILCMRYIIFNHLLVINILMYIVTGLFVISFLSRLKILRSAYQF